MCPPPLVLNPVISLDPRDICQMNIIMKYIGSIVPGCVLSSQSVCFYFIRPYLLESEDQQPSDADTRHQLQGIDEAML